jgi:hypothetical protein
MKKIALGNKKVNGTECIYSTELERTSQAEQKEKHLYC